MRDEEPEPTTPTRIGEIPGRTLRVVLVVCGVSYLFDGYDLTVYGATLAAVREEWNLTPTTAGAIGSYTLIGMLVGAITAGGVTDVFGRRRTLIFCVTWFSVCTAACASAPSAEVFGLLRFLAGLGLGGALPTLNALTVEYAPPRRRNLMYVAMAIGYPMGGLLAAAIAIPLVPTVGWRVMYLIGAAPLLLVLPLAVLRLPESLEQLVARGRLAEAESLAARLSVTLGTGTGKAHPLPSARAAGLPHLLTGEQRRHTSLSWAAAFCSLLLIYGLNTWLPELMRRSGYPLGSALAFLLVFNAGAILGLLVAGPAADRFGQRRVLALTFTSAGVAVALLAVTDDHLVLYALFAVGGFGTIGAQALLNVFVTATYPPALRAAGIGWTLGVGRLGGILGPFLGGLLLAAGASLDGLFVGVAALALTGAALVAANRPPRTAIGRPSVPPHPMEP